LKEQDCIEQLRHELATVIDSHLMSEVPLGAFLSGGLDSSTTVALMQQRLNHPMHTYSVGFANKNEVAYSELPFAKIVSERFGTIHQEVIATAEELLEEFPDIVGAMDQPTADGINSYLVSKAASEKLTVSISGTGSDELFFGYERDLALHRMLSQDNGLNQLSPEHLRRTAALMARLPERYLTPEQREKKRLISGLAAPEAIFASTMGIGIFDEEDQRRLLSDTSQAAVDWDAPLDVIRYILADPDEPLPAKISRMELRGYAGFVLLRDIDAMSMHHSLEVRVPFLDKRFIEFAFSIPLEYRLRNNESKYLLKRAMEGILPHNIIYRQKMGFGIPLVLWMQGPFRPLIEQALSSENVRQRGIFKVPEVERMRREFFAGQTLYERRLWTLFMLEMWMQRFIDRKFSTAPTVAEAKGDAVCAGATS